MNDLWFHAAHGLHDEAHHQHHRPLDLCVPLWSSLPAPSGPALDADVLGMALDMVDEEDGRVGVVGRGRKVDRVVVEYERLMREGSAET